MTTRGYDFLRQSDLQQRQKDRHHGTRRGYIRLPTARQQQRNEQQTPEWRAKIVALRQTTRPVQNCERIQHRRTPVHNEHFGREMPWQRRRGNRKERTQRDSDIGRRRSRYEAECRYIHYPRSPQGNGYGWAQHDSDIGRAKRQQEKTKQRQSKNRGDNMQRKEHSLTASAQKFATIHAACERT